jgi:2,4-dienoyl-CoA reductase-like NADH-dependent reductase (Old Yellow Enzyme family)
VARGGVAAIVAGFVSVDGREDHLPSPRLPDDKHMGNRRAPAAAVKENGAKIIMQMACSGSRGDVGDNRGRELPGKAPS